MGEKSAFFGFAKPGREHGPGGPKFACKESHRSRSEPTISLGAVGCSVSGCCNISSPAPQNPGEFLNLEQFGVDSLWDGHAREERMLFCRVMGCRGLCRQEFLSGFAHTSLIAATLSQGRWPWGRISRPASERAKMSLFRPFCPQVEKNPSG